MADNIRHKYWIDHGFFFLLKKSSSSSSYASEKSGIRTLNVMNKFPFEF